MLPRRDVPTTMTQTSVQRPAVRPYVHDGTAGHSSFDIILFVDNIVVTVMLCYLHISTFSKTRKWPPISRACTRCDVDLYSYYRPVLGFVQFVCVSTTVLTFVLWPLWPRGWSSGRVVSSAGWSSVASFVVGRLNRWLLRCWLPLVLCW